MTKPRIYVSGPSRDIERCERAIALCRELGAEITYDWTVGFQDALRRNDPDDHVARALADLDGIRAADVMILLDSDSTSPGRWVEAGGALILCTPVIASVPESARTPGAEFWHRLMECTTDDAAACYRAVIQARQRSSARRRCDPPNACVDGGRCWTPDDEARAAVDAAARGWQPGPTASEAARAVAEATDEAALHAALDFASGAGSPGPSGATDIAGTVRALDVLLHGEQAIVTGTDIRTGEAIKEVVTIPDKDEESATYLLQSVRFMDGTPVLRGVMREIDVPGHVPLRLYTTDCYFVLVEWTRGSEGFFNDDLWSDPGLRVQVLLNGYCAYRADGVRHVYAGDDGYLYYPSTIGLSQAFALIHEIFEEKTP